MQKTFPRHHGRTGDTAVLRWAFDSVRRFGKDPIADVIYRKTSNIRCTLAGYKIVDHSDVVGASPVGAAPTTSSFST